MADILQEAGALRSDGRRNGLCVRTHSSVSGNEQRPARRVCRGKGSRQLLGGRGREDDTIGEGGSEHGGRTAVTNGRRVSLQQVT